MPIIHNVNLTKRFEDLTAVDHLNLDIEEGEIFRLLGPNGAGKTTTVLLLSTVIKPTEGTAAVGGYDIKQNPDDVRKLIGLCFQEPKILWVSTRAQPIVVLAEFNPLSSATDLMRSFLVGTSDFTFNMIRNLVGFSIIFTVAATFAYMKIVERK